MRQYYKNSRKDCQTLILRHCRVNSAVHCKDLINLQNANFPVPHTQTTKTPMRTWTLTKKWTLLLRWTVTTSSWCYPRESWWDIGHLWSKYLHMIYYFMTIIEIHYCTNRIIQVFRQLLAIQCCFVYDCHLMKYRIHNMYVIFYIKYYSYFQFNILLLN